MRRCMPVTEAGRRPMVSFLFRNLLFVLFAAQSVMTAANTAPESQRDVAFWVLREGGRVLLDGGQEYFSDPFQLPPGDLHVIGVDMHGTVTDPKELGPLSKLTEARELFLPARMWSPVSDVKAPYSDEMFDFFRGMTKLEH